MKFITLTLFVFIWTASLFSMDEHIANELAQEGQEEIVKKLGGKEACNLILAQWSHYERRLLVTILNESQWPSHRKGESIPFARGKEVYQDRFLAMINKKEVKVHMQDFKILAELHRVPVFASYSEQMLKFAQFKEHFETEDEVWDQLDRQLTRGK